MIKTSFLNKYLPLLTLFALYACSSNDDSLLDNGKEQTCQAEVYAVKEGGEVVNGGDTRAMFFGGNDGTRWFCIWDEGDNIDVYRSGSKVGSLTPNTYGYASTHLAGTLTGTYNIGDMLDLYMPKADMDYTGQKGTLGDMSANYVFMEATAAVSEVNASHEYVNMGSTTFQHRQFYFWMQFTDVDGVRLNVEKLVIHSANNKLVQTKSRDGSGVTYGDIVVIPEKIYGTYPNEVYVALQNDSEGADTYTFEVTSGGYVYASTADQATRLTKQYYPRDFRRIKRALPLQSAAANIQSSSSVTPHNDGGGDSNGSVNF